MKKLMALIATLGIAVSAAFANIELSANMMFVPSYTSTMKDSGTSSDVSITFPVGENLLKRLNFSLLYIKYIKNFFLCFGGGMIIL